MNRSWLIGFVALSLGCRGTFDVDKYQVADSSGTGDTADPSTSTTDPTSETSTDTDTSTDTIDTDTGETCPPELGGECIGIIQVIDVGVPPRDIDVGDFIFDARDELLIAASPVMMVQGMDGRMFGSVSELSGIDAIGIAVTDLNGDSMPDFAAVDSLQTSLQESLGDGTFNTGLPIPGGGHDAAFGNLFGGGGQEIVISGGVALRVHDPDLAWIEVQMIPDESESIAIGRFDELNDAFLDVAVTRPSGEIAGFINDGAMLTGFSPFVLPGAVDIIATQLDGGAQELLAVGDDRLWVLRFQEGPSFAIPISHDVGSSPHAVGAGDIDGDGTVDAAVANFGSQDISILFGANGELGPQVRVDPAGPLDMPESIVVSDLDDDGRDEIIVGMLGSNTVVVFGII